MKTRLKLVKVARYYEQEGECWKLVNVFGEPGATIEMRVTDPEAVGQFETGQQFSMCLTPCAPAIPNAGQPQ